MLWRSRSHLNDPLPPLAALSGADAETTIAAMLVEIDPDFELDCDLLVGFGLGPPRTVMDLALLVNQSHGSLLVKMRC